MTEQTLTAEVPRMPLGDRIIFKFGRVLNRMISWTMRPDRPSFYESKTAVYPALKILDDNYEIIREEMERLLPDSVIIPRYHDLDPRQTYISGTVNPEKAWRVFAIQTPIGAPVKNQTRCPQTTALIKRVPNVIQGFFSILEPGKSIPAHCADDYDYLRYHLALRVPQDNPPSLRVKDRIHTWTEGGSILFDDSFDHEVFNESKEHRVVLIVDLLRPLPLPLHLLNVFFIRCLLPFVSSAKATLMKL